MALGTVPRNARIEELKKDALRKFQVSVPAALEYSQLAEDLYRFVLIELRAPCVSKEASTACSTILKDVKASSDGQDKFQALYNLIKQSEDAVVAPHLLRYPDFKAQATHAWASRAR